MPRSGDPPVRRRHDPLPERVAPPAPSPVDLHTHSIRSDGVLTPRELVEAAAACGVRVLALTDHDTLAGYRELIGGDGAPEALPLQLIAGIEINAVTRGLPELPEGELHVLGYGVDPNDEAFEATIVRQRDARRIRFERTVQRLRDLGLPIDDQVAQIERNEDDALGRPTIGRCLVRAGHATSVEDAFRRLIGRGGPAYVPREGLDPVGAIGAIRAAGGLPVLAHFGEAGEHMGLLRELRDRGLGGLEVHYRAFDAPTVESLAAIAAALGLVPTGGSDYHGDTGTYAEHHAGLWVPPEVGEAVLARREDRPGAPTSPRAASASRVPA